ncbi:hypothetical protein B0H12DRAFT_1103265 [Mycena haematopus]|nr:hypothetical protein B0H12DRAFT_1103265 [Mycena haematopus]
MRSATLTLVANGATRARKAARSGEEARAGGKRTCMEATRVDFFRGDELVGGLVGFFGEFGAGEFRSLLRFLGGFFRLLGVLLRLLGDGGGLFLGLDGVAR